MGLTLSRSSRGSQHLLPSSFINHNNDVTAPEFTSLEADRSLHQLGADSVAEQQDIPLHRGELAATNQPYGESDQAEHRSGDRPTNLADFDSPGGITER